MRKRELKEKTNNRKKTKRKIDKKIFFAIIFVFILIMSIFLIVNFVKRNSSQVNTQKSINKEKEISTEQKFKNINSLLDQKINDLKNRLNDYIKTANIKKEELNILYIEPKSNTIYKYNSDKKVAMKYNNLFILSMIAEDLARENKIDINKNIEISKYTAEQEENRDKYITLSKLLEESLFDKTDWKIKATIENIEVAARYDWLTYANKFYGLKINTQNQLSLDDLANIFTRLLFKEENNYAYKETIERMINSAKNKEDLYILNNKYFIGTESENSYGYTIENAIIVGKDDFAYSIYLESSSKEVLNNIRQIILDWHEKYSTK